MHPAGDAARLVEQALQRRERRELAAVAAREDEIARLAVTDQGQRQRRQRQRMRPGRLVLGLLPGAIQDVAVPQARRPRRAVAPSPTGSAPVGRSPRHLGAAEFLAGAPDRVDLLLQHPLALREPWSFGSPHEVDLDQILLGRPLQQRAEAGQQLVGRGRPCRDDQLVADRAQVGLRERAPPAGQTRLEVPAERRIDPRQRLYLRAFARSWPRIDPTRRQASARQPSADAAPAAAAAPRYQSARSACVLRRGLPPVRPRKVTQWRAAIGAAGTVPKRPDAPARCRHEDKAEHGEVVRFPLRKMRNCGSGQAFTRHFVASVCWVQLGAASALCHGSRWYATEFKMQGFQRLGAPEPTI